MTIYTNHLTRGRLAQPGLDGVPRIPVAFRTQSAVRRVRVTARLLLAVVLEAVILLVTLQVLAGIGYEGQAGWQPTPAGAHAVAPAALEVPGAAPVAAPRRDPTLVALTAPEPPASYRGQR